jgi:ATP-dependent RNA helicase SrmB
MPVRKMKGLAPQAKSNKKKSKDKDKPRYIAKKDRA